MLYIITALKSEAQAFVEKYGLIKKSSDGYTIFENDELRVIVSGVGIESAKKAAAFLLKNFAIEGNDIFINIGICAADKRYKVGTLINIDSIAYNKEKHTLKKSFLHTITCSDEELSSNLYDIADMESFGFYEATKEIENRYIFKVVSDNFEPCKVTKDGTKKLIFNAIDAIMKEVIR